MQHEHQPQHIDTLSSYKTKNNYNSIELHPRPNQYTAYPKKYQQGAQQQINYPNSIAQSYDGQSAGANHHHNNQGAYLYKVENFTSFGTISCGAENQYGSSGPCLYHIMVAGKLSFIKLVIHETRARLGKGSQSCKCKLVPWLLAQYLPNINLDRRVCGWPRKRGKNVWNVDVKQMTLNCRDFWPFPKRGINSRCQFPCKSCCTHKTFPFHELPADRQSTMKFIITSIGCSRAITAWNGHT